MKQALQQMVMDLDGLERQVGQMLSFKEATYKRVPLFASAGVVFARGEFAAKEAVWVNGGEDFHMCGLSYSVVVRDNSTNIFGMVDQGQMMEVSGIGDPTRFDFMWNFRLASTASRYCMPANGVQFMPRPALGNRDRGGTLEFDSPYLVAGGDSVITTIKPVFFGPADVPASTVAFIVELVPWGYRTGAMADSAFDRGVG